MAEQLSELTISVQTLTLWSVGIRIWYVLRDSNNNLYQRWSNDGNDTDQVLMVAKPGDSLVITIGRDTAHSLAQVSAAPTVSPFAGGADAIAAEPTNIILTAAFAQPSGGTTPTAT